MRRRQHIQVTIYKNTTEYLFSRLPNIQPSISQLHETCATGEVILGINLVPLRIQSIDIVEVGSSHAQPIAVAPIQELSDSFTPPNRLDS